MRLDLNDSCRIITFDELITISAARVADDTDINGHVVYFRADMAVDPEIHLVVDHELTEVVAVGKAK
jgi:hypothetical protein